MSLIAFKKIWRLLGRSQRRWYLILTGMMGFGAGLEMAGIGLLLPLLALMVQSDLILKRAAMAPLLDLLGHPSPGQLVMLSMITFIGINVIRVGFLVGLAWLQSRFLKDFIVGLSQVLYTGYLAKPYTFHLQQNSAQLIRNTTGEVAVVAGAVQNTLSLLSENMVAVGIAALLLAVDPLGVLLLITLLGSSAWCFHHITRLRISKWGEQRQHHEGMRIQQLQQGIGGIKEIKLLGLEAFVIDEYRSYNIGSAQANQRHTFMQSLPRLWLEILVILGLGLYVIGVLFKGRAVATLLPTLGMFGAAAFRLMPSMNRILGAVQGIRYATPALDNLVTEVESFDGSELARPLIRGQHMFSNAIEIVDLGYTYPTGHRPALDHVTIHIQRGASVGFVGGSGAGKSTLIDLILGLLSPQNGKVLVDGVDIRKRLKEWQRQMGYVPQAIYLSDDTLRRNIAFGLPDGQIDNNAVHRAVELAQLEIFIRELPQGLDTPVGERGVRLSGGQRQRIGIARALYYDPPILVLDEATSALDNETEAELMKAVTALQGEKTLLIVAHRLTTVARCDMIYRLEGGKLMEFGPPQEVLHDIPIIKRQTETL